MYFSVANLPAGPLANFNGFSRQVMMLVLLIVVAALVASLARTLATLAVAGGVVSLATAFLTVAYDSRWLCRAGGYYAGCADSAHLLIATALLFMLLTVAALVLARSKWAGLLLVAYASYGGDYVLSLTHSYRPVRFVLMGAAAAAIIVAMHLLLRDIMPAKLRTLRSS